VGGLGAASGLTVSPALETVAVWVRKVDIGRDVFRIIPSFNRIRPVAAYYEISPTSTHLNWRTTADNAAGTVKVMPRYAGHIHRPHRG